ncbi:Membrane protein TerC, possibly involved in tellurium resistance [Monaibacterium marinum]|uniref:Membrane protein TerC, possibly involved in tellurium resistance n=1 Tax=Pontivivens marinum TaxID=1690039 RepID=A0A2C9CMS3_9RHOB|nr:tellurium resistance protein TerC [Monaibacterium marinum]SOH92563.1 Membrane protein TerC, possibly involved in tellurium resistance [Monaibacterium marinum]
MELLTLENLGTLVMLIFLQAVLGFDNLLYISIESQRAPIADQARVRRWGILIAIALRIILLFVMIQLLQTLSQTLFSLNFEGIITGEFTFATLVFLFGGGFIMYTAVKEIAHLLAMDHLGHGVESKQRRSAASVIAMIVFMNLIFSFDSILSAIAITTVFPILAIAILLSGLAMLLLADTVSEFIEKNRMYEVLGLMVLLIVGVVLLGEGGHQAHMKLFGYEVLAMSKSTFYFSIVVLFVVQVLQTGYRRKLEAVRAHRRTQTSPEHVSNGPAQ